MAIVLSLVTQARADPRFLEVPTFWSDDAQILFQVIEREEEAFLVRVRFLWPQPTAGARYSELVLQQDGRFRAAEPAGNDFTDLRYPSAIAGTWTLQAFIEPGRPVGEPLTLVLTDSRGGLEDEAPPGITAGLGTSEDSIAAFFSASEDRGNSLGWREGDDAPSLSAQLNVGGSSDGSSGSTTSTAPSGETGGGSRTEGFGGLGLRGSPSSGVGAGIGSLGTRRYDRSSDPLLRCTLRVLWDQAVSYGPTPPPSDGLGHVFFSIRRESSACLCANGEPGKIRWNLGVVAPPDSPFEVDLSEMDEAPEEVTGCLKAAFEKARWPTAGYGWGSRLVIEGEVRP